VLLCIRVRTGTEIHCTSVFLFFPFLLRAVWEAFFFLRIIVIQWIAVQYFYIYVPIFTQDSWCRRCGGPFFFLRIIALQPPSVALLPSQWL